MWQVIGRSTCKVHTFVPHASLSWPLIIEKTISFQGYVVVVVVILRYTSCSCRFYTAIWMQIFVYCCWCCWSACLHCGKSNFMSAHKHTHALTLRQTTRYNCIHESNAFAQVLQLHISCMLQVVICKQTSSADMFKKMQNPPTRRKYLIIHMCMLQTWHATIQMGLLIKKRLNNIMRPLKMYRYECLSMKRQPFPTPPTAKTSHVSCGKLKQLTRLICQRIYLHSTLISLPLTIWRLAALLQCLHFIFVAFRPFCLWQQRRSSSFFCLAMRLICYTQTLVINCNTR